MKTKILALSLCTLPLLANAQAAFDALKLSENELRGTARSMSMAGAYTALGGDLSTLNQNPGGIGVYRSSDVGITMSLDFNKSSVDHNNMGFNKTRFIVNNIGYVGAMKVNSDILKNFNWGFSYNRTNEVHRHFGGSQNLSSSMSNYIADRTNEAGWTEADLSNKDAYYSDKGIPWASILAYNSYMINPYKQADGSTLWGGLMGNGTTGFGEYEVEEWGHTDEYSITLGGNFANILSWGLGFGINDMQYNSYTYYGEGLYDSYQINNPKLDNPGIVNGDASWGWENYLRTRGTGYNFKLGFIVKPINELRLGFAFHTPTFYELRDTYGTTSAYKYTNSLAEYNGVEHAGNSGLSNAVRYNFHTPWRFMAGAAGVIGKSGIISIDYEYMGYNTMGFYDYRSSREWADVKADIKSYFKPSHIVRVGGEYRVTPSVSIRAGYSYQSSPIKDQNIEEGTEGVYTVSNNPAYRYDTKTQYFTCGIGYRYRAFYADLAYIHQARDGKYHAYSPSYYTADDGTSQMDFGVMDKVSTHNNHVALTLGVRF